jgi:septum formation protein
MLVLASGSARRAELLRAAGLTFEVRPSGAAEWPYWGGEPAAYAEALARAKAAAVTGDIVVGADTVVVVDGTVLGKPGSPAEAASMLRRLSGRAHEVITAVAVQRDGRVRCGHATARVGFRRLSEREIEEYVAAGEPLDKAGGYAFQGGAAAFSTLLEGSADTVIGLPIRLVQELLAASAQDR